MIPKNIEYFKNDGVGLEVHKYREHTTYWITMHHAAIEFREPDFSKLVELLKAYAEEEL